MTNKNLTGKKEIMTYTRRSWKTINVWINKEQFPAKKLDGVWESMTDLVDQWKQKRIMKPTS